MTEYDLKIAVFGPGYGESTVIFIPQLGWGVIDSCVYKEKGKSINPALEYLKENKVEKISFLVLTHPHRDHFQGINRIVDHFLGRIDRICYYSGNGLREYRTYLAKKHVLRELGLTELANIFSAFKKARDCGAHICKISENTSLTPISEDNIKIIALSPSEESENKYIEILHKSIPKKDGDTIPSLKDREHNLISVVLYIEINELRLVFGGDLENGNCNYTGWKGIINSPNFGDLSADFMKVPHHGSPNAFYKPIWDKISKNNRPFSVVTPYNRSTPPLPRTDILENIQNYSSHLAVTSKFRTSKPSKIYDSQVTKNMHGVIDWKYLVKPKKVGSVEAFFSSKTGNLVDYKIKNPAYIYK